MPVEFTGDEQIRRRSAAPLLEALSGLGIRAESLHGNGCAPILIQGPWKGGRVSLPCPTSQYLSAILLAAPLAPPGAVTEVLVPLLNEKPYIELTLSYLKAQNIPYEAAGDFSRFVIPGGASWKPVSGPVPGDFSSAAFPGCAAAVSGGDITLLGLDPEDSQGDKAFFDMLARMGCHIRWEKRAENGGSTGPAPCHVNQKPRSTFRVPFPAGPGESTGIPGQSTGPTPCHINQNSRSTFRVPIPAGPEWALSVSRQGPLEGGVFDLNATPDMLPAAAVTAACARGDTALVNAAHARIKETDRIAVMAAELVKLGVRCTEQPDGLIIHGRTEDGGKPPLNGGSVNGCGDHRIVMALAAAALGASGPVEIQGAESAAVTYPGFLELLDAKTIET
jgi:3-phosphoshikimate 1-carboxyvinyltransferase